MSEPVKTVCQNRKARHDYHILEKFEAGLVLQGTEVKSLRDGRANLQDSFARISNSELWLENMHISPYEQAGQFNHEPKRARKLLMHKREIMRLLGKTQQKGLALIPLRVYFRSGKAKVELALARGKKEYDKREDIKKREAEREIARLARGKV